MASRNSYNQQLLKSIIENKPKPIKKPRISSKISESDIQQACMKWFRLQYPQLASDGVLFHIPNEGIRLGGIGRRMKREGIVRGVADLCLAVPRKGYAALYIEMKKPGSYQSPEQKAWQKSVERYGNKYVVCKSLEQFIQIITDYLS